MVATETPATPTSKHRSWQQGPLPEIIGYVGAALVASAGLNFMGQSWEQWTPLVRLSVIGVTALLLAAAGLIIMGLAGWRAGLLREDRANRRRLVAVLLALAAPLIGAFLAVILDSRGLFDQVSGWLIAPGVLALVAAVLAAWCAPGAVTTIVVAATSAWTGITTTVVIAEDQPAWWIPIIASAFGAAWLALAPRLLAVPPLSESLGMAWLLLMLGPAAITDPADPVAVASDQAVAVWVSRGLLVAMALIALTLFARGASGAWAVGGVIAAVLASMGFTGQALGWVAALLVAGVVLLTLSGLLLAVRRRSADSGAATSAPEP